MYLYIDISLLFSNVWIKGLRKYLKKKSFTEKKVQLLFKVSVKY